MRSLVILAVMMISFSSQAVIRDVGNGGDAVVLEFTNLARQVSRDIRLNADYLFPEFSSEQLDLAIEKTKVVSEEKTILNGVEKDAINHPDLNLIEVSRSRWALNYDSIERLQSLVFHEYLGIMKIDDSDFKISGRLLDYYKDSRKNISGFELTGRIFLNDQMDSNTQGLLKIDYPGNIVFEGMIAGEELSCVGTYSFNENRQVLDSSLTCDNSNAQIILNFWNTDIVDFLRKGLVEVDFSFIKESADGSTKKLIQKTIDAKHLN